MNYWLVKQEPESYSWSDFKKEGRTAWTGVRNYQSRNNLRAMKKGDLVLFYHSVSDKEIVGIASVAKEAYPDPLAEEGDWSAVDLVPARALNQPVSLAAIKGEAGLQEMYLVRHSRLSVAPVIASHFNRILQLGQTKLTG